MDFLISKEALYFYTPVGMVLRVKLNKALPKFSRNSHFFLFTFWYPSSGIVMYYLFFSHTQILTIFRQNTCFSKCQFSGPLWSIWTYNTNFLLKIEWGLWKNMFFSILSPKKGCFGGINKFDPHNFWTIFMQKKFSGAIYWPLRTKSKILRCTFFQKLYKLSNDI